MATATPSFYSSCSFLRDRLRDFNLEPWSCGPAPIRRALLAEVWDEGPVESPVASSVDIPRGSKYPIFEVSGSKNHTMVHGMVFGTRNNGWFFGSETSHLQMATRRLRGLLSCCACLGKGVKPWCLDFVSSSWLGIQILL